MDRVAELNEEGRTATEIADCLNREGFSTPKRRGSFSPVLICQLLVRRGLTKTTKRVEPLGPHEWRLPELAKHIPVSAAKLADWVRRGWLHSRKARVQRLWILWADKREVRRLRKLADVSHRGIVEYPSQLTTPTEKNSR